MTRKLFIALLLAGCAQAPADKADVDAQKAEAFNRAKIHTELAATYFDRGQHAIALEELKEAFNIDPAYGPAYNIAGLVNMELNDDPQAEKNFQQALKIDPQDSDAHNNYGHFLCSRGRGAEGIPHFEAALKDPLYTTPQKALANAGVCARRMNNDKAAEEYFVKALRIEPGNAVSLYHVADIHYKRGQLAEARTFLARQLEVAAATPEALWLGVRIERKLGDRNAEASYGLQLRRKFPGSPEAKALIDRRYE
jgi:type IV pilus assembly protein PilF